MGEKKFDPRVKKFCGHALRGRKIFFKSTLGSQSRQKIFGLSPHYTPPNFAKNGPKTSNFSEKDPLGVNGGKMFF